jgi:hypothetical protein
MISPSHPLRRLFHETVSDCFRETLPHPDSEIAAYVADMLTEFSSTNALYQVRDSEGRSIRDLEALLLAADPVHGTATSFDDERRLRKYIGDYLLFSAGMAPKNSASDRRRDEMVRNGQESYWVVSQFNLFEYEREAPLFARLSNAFEPCMRGLHTVYARLQQGQSRLLM